MTFKWIAALISPADVAPHPNFRATELSATELFALLAQARFVDYDRFADPEWDKGLPAPTGGKPVLIGTAQELASVKLCRRAFEPAQSEGALSELASQLRTEDTEPFFDAALTLLGSTLLAELDRQEEGIALIRRMLGRLGDGPCEGVARALALQHLALRLFERGGAGAEESTEALRILRAVRLRDLEEFSLSKGVSWRSGKTVGAIRKEITAAAESHLARLEPLGGTGWQRIVRKEPPTLSLRTSVRGMRGYQEAAKERFREGFHAGGQTVFLEDPVDPPIYAALLHYDLVGHSGEVFGWRSQLAIERGMRMAESEGRWHGRETIRLLRQADNQQFLDIAVRNIRAGGPLLALHDDASQIGRAKIGSAAFTTTELTVIAASAQVLSTELSIELFEAIERSIRSGDPGASLRWELPSNRLDKALTAAAALAGPLSYDDRLAGLLFEVAENSEDDDALINHTLARIAMGLDWRTISPDLVESWRHWTEGPSSMQRSLREAIRAEVEIQTPDAAEAVPSLTQIADVANRHLQSKTEIPTAWSEAAKLAITRACTKIRRDAAEHSFTIGGGPSVAELALALAHLTSDESLWRLLGEFLSDQRVARHDKTAALDRIAEGHWKPPSSFSKILATTLDEVLSSGPESFLEPTVSPYPSLLRASVTLGLAEEAEVVDRLSQLAAGDRSARVEAARTVRVVARQTDWQWVSYIGLQLSQDSDHVVRAEAGRSLASISRWRTDTTPLVFSRLLALLREDGLLIPTLVLRGIEENRTSLPTNILEEVANVAKSHIAFGIRVLANSIGNAEYEERK